MGGRSVGNDAASRLGSAWTGRGVAPCQNKKAHPAESSLGWYVLSRYEWEAKTQMQRMGFILRITENKHKSNHPEGENQKLNKHKQGKSREQAGQSSRQTSGK